MSKRIAALFLILTLTATSIFAFSSVYEATSWIYSNIRYVRAQGEGKTIAESQTPNETLKLRKGNCVDMSILLCAIIDEYDLNGEEDIYLIGLRNPTTGAQHLVVQVGYLLYDATAGKSLWGNPEGYTEVILKRQYKGET